MGLIHRARVSGVLVVAVALLVALSLATWAAAAGPMATVVIKGVEGSSVASAGIVPCEVRGWGQSTAADISQAHKTAKGDSSPLLGATYISEAWWTNQVDNDHDNYFSSERLNWDADVTSGGGSYSVYVKVFMTPAAGGTTSLIWTSPAYTINGTDIADSRYLNLYGGSHILWDVAIELWRVGQPSADYTRNSVNDADLNDYATEFLSDDVGATIADAWWTGKVDNNVNGYCWQARLNWDPNVVGSTGSLSVFERIYYRVSDGRDGLAWHSLTGTSPHTITGAGSADVQTTGSISSGKKWLLDFRIEIYREGETVPDYTIDSTNDTDLQNFRMESYAEDNIATLTVQSSPISAIVITGTPAGTTQYSASYAFNTPVSVVAPSKVVRLGRTYWFVRWKRNGVNQTTGQRTLAFNIPFDTTVIAGYKGVRYLKILGPASVPEDSVATYKCKAYYTDGTSKYVTSLARWSENSSYAKFSRPGRLVTYGVSSDKRFKITVSYGGKKGTKYVTIKD